MRNEIKNIINNMRKFTYSSSFKIDNETLNDIGWGCTIRAG